VIILHSTFHSLKLVQKILPDASEETQLIIATSHERTLLGSASSLVAYRDGMTLKQRFDDVHRLWLEKKDDLNKLHLQSPKDTTLKAYIKKYLNEIDSQVVMSVLVSLTQDEIKALAFMDTVNGFTQNKLVELFVEVQPDMKNKLGMYLLIVYLILWCLSPCEILHFISSLVLSTASMRKGLVDDAMARFTTQASVVDSCTVPELIKDPPVPVDLMSLDCK